MWLTEQASSKVRGKDSKSLFEGVLKGDGNRDGNANIIDVNILINYLYFQKAMDMNNDNKINEKDLEILVDQLYGKGMYKKS